MRTEEHAALVRRAVEAIWNRGELDVADALFATDYVNHDGVITDLVRGPEAIKVSVALYRTAFPDLHITVDDLTADGERVLLHWTARGPRAADPSSGAPTTAGTLTGTLTSRLAGGQIVESWVQWDRDGALTQLGLLPSLGEHAHHGWCSAHPGSVRTARTASSTEVGRSNVAAIRK